MSDKATLEQLKEKLRGRVVASDDPDYDDIRSVWNGMIDRRPSMIARCTGVADVTLAVKIAREHNRTITVRGGGHGVAGKAVSDDTLMIDLSLMNSVHVNPMKKTARVGAGAKLGDLDHESQAFGLATTGGVVSTTGVAGLTLGGGVGFLCRRFGLTIDNLLSADVVTADGELLHASEEDNPDLFWALRGGGGNFGIVTSFEFRLHEVGPEVVTAQIFYPYENAREVLHSYLEFMADAPDELLCYAFAANVPPAPPFPEHLHRKTCIALVACYSGSTDKGLSLLEPLRKIGQPILDLISPVPYTSLQQTFDTGMPKGARYYWKAHFIKELTDEAIETVIKLSDPLPGPYSMIGIEPLGGAVSRVDSNATAFAHRDASFSFGMWSGWVDPADDDKSVAWTRKYHEAMRPFASGGAYLNYLDHDDGSMVAATHGANYARLQKIKAKYDPDNFFSMNQNITPAK